MDFLGEIGNQDTGGKVDSALALKTQVFLHCQIDRCSFSVGGSVTIQPMAKAKKKKRGNPPPKRKPVRGLAAIDLTILRLLNDRLKQVHRQAAAEGASVAVEHSLASTGRALDKLPPSSQLDRNATASFLTHIASICHLGLHTDRVAFLGPEFSFSHLAATKHFGEAHPFVVQPTIAAVFEAIVRHDARLGVVPIENSTDGRVVDTLSMFIKHPVKVCGEVLMPIHHYLLGKCARGEIREVYSKPQALSQCRNWLSSHLPQVRLVEMASTAAAAQLAVDRQGAAAIASLEAGRRQNLNVIDANIEDNPNNITRFVVLGDREVAPTGTDKTSVLFQVPHEPGALADSLQIFKRAELNLTWIESFPMPGHDGQYVFFLELVGHVRERHVAHALEQLAKRSLRLDVIGSYPRGKPPAES